ncbi:MAG: porin family protein [Xanthobacteraceae bacterium]|jgi:opacity protein-like surface antigen|nr:porin family protein [Xanthobacteraceae bacterium]
MKKFALAAAAAITLSVSSQAVNAADMPPPILRAPPAPWVELGSNWYLRGDFTYRMFDVSGANGPEDAAMFGAGIGYQFASWLRGDVTLDYQFGSSFSATDNPAVAGAKLWSSALFANAYVDLGTWYGVTPYVGAGVGAAFNDLDSEGRWNFAWALMAGAAYHLSPNLSIDFGYRYADLGSAYALTGALVDVTTQEFKIGLRYKLD